MPLFKQMSTNPTTLPKFIVDYYLLVKCYLRSITQSKPAPKEAAGYQHQLVPIARWWVRYQQRYVTTAASGHGPFRPPWMDGSVLKHQ